MRGFMSKYRHLLVSAIVIAAVMVAGQANWPKV